MTPETIFTLLAATVLGAFLHRMRGGGLSAIPRFPGRSLWTAALVFGAVTAVAFDPMIGLALLLAYLGGSVHGWGSYFDLGRKRDGWGDDPEVEWIDTALRHLFGPEWAGDKGHIHPIRGYTGDVIYNEGRIRSASWRFWRDFTGLALRGLHYLPMFAVLPLVGLSWWAVLPGGVALALFAPAYWLGHKTPGGTGTAEWIVGGIFGAALATQYLLVVDSIT